MKPQRRRFGRFLGNTVAAAFTKARPSSSYYLILGRSAMACQFQVYLRPEHTRFTPAVHEALNLIDTLEQQMSAYREDSELSLINRAGFPGPIRVERQLYRLLRRAREISADTGGAFDITTGPLVRCWGFFEREGRVPDPEALQRSKDLCGWDKVELNDDETTIRFLRPGMELNLGGIGKGYALDRAAAFLGHAGLADFMIHAGHSTILARGNSNAGLGWEVSIRDPDREGASLGSIRLRNRAMSASGSGEQYFVSRGKKYGHILDPRTGEPSFALKLCAVTAPSAASADALSTALFVLSAGDAMKYCELHPSVGSLRVACGETGKGTVPSIRRFSLKSTEALL